MSNTINHQWKPQTINIDRCQICGCIRERRVEKGRYWKHYVVYIINNKEYKKAPDCINPDDATGDLFLNEKK